MSGTAGFRDALSRNAGVSHGPLARDAAVAMVCERVRALAGDDPVAIPSRDPLLEAMGVTEALRGTGFDLVGPDHPAWGEAVARCAVGVTGSRAAVAETGTVAVACGPGAPRAVSLLPDSHVCVVAVSSIEARFEDAFTRAVAEGLPPNLVWISGPSRSADIEKRITLGVHGPRTFEVVLVDA